MHNGLENPILWIANCRINYTDFTRDGMPISLLAGAGIDGVLSTGAGRSLNLRRGL
jgi:hypothetical protein